MAAPKENDRGEVRLTLDGTAYVLRPSYQAIMDIEEATGLSLFELTSTADKQALTIRQMAIIAQAMIAAYGRETKNDTLTRFKVDRIAELMFEAGAMAVQPFILVVLYSALTGGVDASGKRKPATETKKAAAAAG